MSGIPPTTYSSAIGQFVIGYSAIGEPQFSPATPGLPNVIPSYLYAEYSDDDDLQAFVAAQNALTQEWVNWFNQIGLPIYTGPLIAGALLDWVAQGLYGISRPVLPSGQPKTIGPYGTWAFGAIPYGILERLGPSTYYATNDDYFKRIITWHFFKGDGKVFNIRWLKRRVMRFLIGTDGTAPNIDQTYRISVSFGTGNQVNIRILNSLTAVTGGAVYGAFAYGTQPYGALTTSVTPLSQFPAAPIFKAAVDAGALELPFQFTYVVNIS